MLMFMQIMNSIIIKATKYNYSTECRLEIACKSTCSSMVEAF